MAEHTEPDGRDAGESGDDVVNDRPEFQGGPDEADGDGPTADNGGNAPGTGPDTTSKD